MNVFCQSVEQNLEDVVGWMQRFCKQPTVFPSYGYDWPDLEGLSDYTVFPIYSDGNRPNSS
jgi:hypothetical protein